MKLNKILAFTLAEVLVVIGVIGIVSALTLPNLSSDTQDRETVARFKKAKMVLNEAMGRAVAKYGPMYKWSEGTTNTSLVANRLFEGMSVQKICGANEGCWNTDGYVKSYEANTFPKVLLSDGSSFVIGTASSNIIKGKSYIDVYYDLDGPKKGDNAVCSDIFVLRLYENKTTSMVIQSGSANPSPKGASFCTDWLDRFENTDYLKTSDGWNCLKGGKVLDWVTNTSCN